MIAAVVESADAPVLLGAAEEAVVSCRSTRGPLAAVEPADSADAVVVFNGVN
jgi:hypothetical protein